MGVSSDFFKDRKSAETANLRLQVSTTNQRKPSHEMAA